MIQSSIELSPHREHIPIQALSQPLSGALKGYLPPVVGMIDSRPEGVYQHGYLNLPHAGVEGEMEG